MKPCQTVQNLPCSGSEGACLGRPYWDGKPFSDASGAKNKLKRRIDKDCLEACPWIEAVNAWWEESEAILGPTWTPEQRAQHDSELRAEPYKPHLRGRIAEEPETYMEDAE